MFLTGSTVFTANGSASFSLNYAQYGGAIMIHAGATMNMGGSVFNLSGGTISNNVASAQGYNW